jgi:hypothetical protein
MNATLAELRIDIQGEHKMKSPLTSLFQLPKHTEDQPTFADTSTAFQNNWWYLSADKERKLTQAKEKED